MSSTDKDLSFINAEWVKKYCDMMTDDYTESFERNTRSRNDSYSNGEFSGKLHALKDLKRLIESIERVNKPLKTRDVKNSAKKLKNTVK